MRTASGLHKICGKSSDLAAIRTSGGSKEALQGTYFHKLVENILLGREGSAEHEPDKTGLNESDISCVGEWLPLWRDRAFARLNPDASVEREIALDARGGLCANIDDKECVISGHPDIIWPDGELAIVWDWKTGEMDLGEPNDSLQLLVYGVAACRIYNKERFSAAHYYARTGELRFGASDVSADKAWIIVRRYLGINGDAVPGPHCFDCYQRNRCEDFLELGKHDNALIPSAETSVSPAQVAKLYRACKAMEMIAEAGLKYVNEYVASGAGNVEYGGKRLGYIDCKGREGADMEAIRRDGATQYIKQGSPYRRLQWRKA